MATTHLAFISEDSSLQVAAVSDDGPGQPETRLAMEREGLLFMWPTWAPDSASLAVSASSHQRQDPRLELWRIPLGEGASNTLYANPPDARQIFAPGLAHYVNWSPTGRVLAVVSNVGNGLAASLVSESGRVEPRRLVDGAPLYFAWAPDGRAMLVHRGAQLQLLDLASDRGERQLLRARPSFRTPAWSVDGQRFFYAAPRAGGGCTVMLGHRSDDDREELLDVGGSSEGGDANGVAFVRAPRHDRLAILPIPDSHTDSSGILIHDLDTRVERQLSARPANAVVWAPNGESLFAFEPMPGTTMIALTRYDLQTDRSERLTRFQPSAEFASMLAFFDQFAQSHQLVSPDGRWITFSGLALNNGGSGRRGFGPQNGCYVVPTDASAPAQRVAAGSIGFFANQLANQSVDAADAADAADADDAPDASAASDADSE